MITQEYTYAYAAVSVTDGQMDSLILPHVNGACMQVSRIESGYNRKQTAAEPLPDAHREFRARYP